MRDWAENNFNVRSHSTNRKAKARQQKPVSMADMGPGLRRDDEAEAIQLLPYSAAAFSGGRTYLSRRVTNSSAMVGWTAQVASH